MQWASKQINAYFADQFKHFTSKNRRDQASRQIIQTPPPPAKRFRQNALAWDERRAQEQRNVGSFFFWNG